MRQDALAAGVVNAVVQVLARTSEDTLSENQELAAVILSRYALEPESHGLIANAGAIPVRLQILQAAAVCFEYQV